jgi:hypothetical protein
MKKRREGAEDVLQVGEPGKVKLPWIHEFGLI